MMQQALLRIEIRLASERIVTHCSGILQKFFADSCSVGLDSVTVYITVKPDS